MTTVSPQLHPELPVVSVIVPADSSTLVTRALASAPAASSARRRTSARAGGTRTVCSAETPGSTVVEAVGSAATLRSRIAAAARHCWKPTMSETATPAKRPPERSAPRPRSGRASRWRS